jgi:hypothetical protein
MMNDMLGSSFPHITREHFSNAHFVVAVNSWVTKHFECFCTIRLDIGDEGRVVFSVKNYTFDKIHVSEIWECVKCCIDKLVINDSSIRSDVIRNAGYYHIAARLPHQMFDEIKTLSDELTNSSFFPCELASTIGIERGEGTTLRVYNGVFSIETLQSIESDSSQLVFNYESDSDQDKMSSRDDKEEGEVDGSVSDVREPVSPSRCNSAEDALDHLRQSKRRRH